MTSFSIRPFDNSDRDFEANALLNNVHYPEHPTTPQEMRDEDARRDPKIKKARFVAETPSGEIVGVASYGQSQWNYDPHKFIFTVFTAPDKQKVGIGGALYEKMVEGIVPFAPTKISCHVREDMTQSVSFALNRDFVEEMREWESKLDVAAFDFGPWQNAHQKSLEKGVVICSLAELAGDPDRNRKVWETEMEMSQDVPSPDPFTPLSFETYQKQILSDPHHLPDGFFVAVHEASGEYVGTTNLWKRGSDNDLNTGLTAVKCDWRRKGIALALKLRAIKFGKSYGAGSIRTENATTNEAMLSINVALGFARQPAWISYGKILATGNPAAS